MPQKSRSDLTFRFDILRGGLLGLQQAWVHTFALVILIKYFDGSDFLKSMVFGSSFLGMIASTIYGPSIGNFLKSKSAAVAFPIFACGLLMVLVSLSTNVVFYSTIIGLAFMVLPTHLPLLSSIYHDNFRTANRGLLVSYSIIMAQLVAAIATWIGGFALDASLENFRWMAVISGIGLIIGSFFTNKIPSKSIASNPPSLKAFQYLYKDPLFGYIILAWFIFGFANLWVMPIRIKYLSVELNLNPSTIAIIYGVIPEIARFLLTPIWARIFDRYNFIALRIVLNGFLLMGVLLFFWSKNIYIISLGSALYGVGFAGGRVAWALWTTKMVPKERTADYMAVHVRHDRTARVRRSIYRFSNVKFSG